MKKHYKKFSALTLAEILLVILVVSVIIVLTIKVKKAQINHINRFMTYSAFTSLQQGVEELVTQGYDSTGSTPPVIDYTLPPYGKTTLGPTVIQGFCNRLSELFNTVGTTNCNAPAVGGAGSFTAANANFTTTNGLRFFNLSQNATAQRFIVYVDIDGDRRNVSGSGTLNNDVLKFRVYRSGIVIPNDNLSKLATDTGYLSASVRYVNTENKYVWPVNAVSYKEAICAANVIQSIDSLYCGSLVPNTNCTSPGVCEAVIDKPRAGIF